MQSQNIYKPRDVQVTDLTYSQVKTNKHNARNVYVYHKKGRFRIQTPKMSLSFGASAYPKEPSKDQKQKWSVDFSFRGADENERVGQFKDLIENLDHKVVDDAMEKSIEWFGKQKKRELLEDDDVYKRSLKRAKDKETKQYTDKYPPSMKVKLIQNAEGEIVTELYDENNKPILIREYPDALREKLQKEWTDMHPNDEFEVMTLEEVLPKGVRVNGVIECGMIYFMAGGAFGLSWKALQLKVFPTNGRLNGASFVPDSDDESVENTPAQSDSEVQGSEVSDSGKDSDGDHQPQTESQPEPQAESQTEPQTEKKTRKSGRKPKKNMTDLLDDL